MKQYKKIITTLLACSFLVTSASGITVAAKKPKLSFTTLVLSVEIGRAHV